MQLFILLQEIQELKIMMNKEKDELKEKLSKRNKEFLNLQKATFEKGKEEELSDKNFIINNLTLERNALKKKLEVNIFIIFNTL